MGFQDQSIKHKTLAVMMLATITVLLLSAAGFTVYSLVRYRQVLGAEPERDGRDHCRAHRGFPGRERHRGCPGNARPAPHGYPDRRSGHIRRTGKTARPLSAGAARERLSGDPRRARDNGSRARGSFSSAHPGKRHRLGTLYIRSDPRRLFTRLQAYGGIVLLILLGSVIAAFGLSLALEKRITRPILALATRRLVSERNDYSIRAKSSSRDEMGRLTDAFNGMLSRIEEQTGDPATNRTKPVLSRGHRGVFGRRHRRRGPFRKCRELDAAAERMFGYRPRK